MFHLVASLLVSTTLAADSTPASPVIQDDGTVRSEVFVAADVATVKQALADPVKTAQLCPDILSARVVQKGQCDLVEVTTRGMSSPLTYLVRRCPTSSGWSETMVSSDDFDDVKVSWAVEPAAGGSRVVYTIRSAPNIPVPQRVVTSFTAKSAVQALKNLVLRVTGQ